MSDWFSRVAFGGLLLLFGIYVAEPYLARYTLTEQNPKPVAAAGPISSSEEAGVRVFETVSPSVVHIFARSGAAPSRLDPNRSGAGFQSGTGFLWDAAGHIVTNNHVVQGAQALAVRLGNGEVTSATLVGLAPNYDLAVLRIGRVRNPPPPVVIGASSDLKVGQATFAIGNPFGLDQTLTTGVISALQRKIPTSQGREIGDVIQTDAAINPGNSGGPLLDSSGRLIGVNTAIFSPSGAFAGIGFAIPVDVVNRVVPELIRTGRLPSPGIGIIAADEAIATQLGLEGVVVVQVLRGSPAEQAGLQGLDPYRRTLGDVITAINGERVGRLTDLTSALDAIGIGKPVDLTVERQGQARSVRVEVADVARATNP